MSEQFWDQAGLTGKEIADIVAERDAARAEAAEAERLLQTILDANFEERWQAARAENKRLREALQVIYDNTNDLDAQLVALAALDGQASE